MAIDGPSTVKQGSPVQPGDVLAGKYRVESVLGAGGMGVVVSARHVQLGELVALKFLRTEEVGRGDSVARFLREAQAAIRIKSEHVARVSDMGTLETGAPYIVMEYLAGTDLSALVHAEGPLPIATALEHVLQACEAIAEAHALGIVHRDLKPSNLFLTARFDGSPLVKVLDFGIAKSLEHEGSPSLTASQSMLGSPTYMSPEQVRSARRVDARSDIWSLGIILFELLSGRGPFLAESVHGMLAAIMSDAPDGLCELRPEVPRELEAIVTRCLEKDVGRRFQDVGELARALAPFAPRAHASVERITSITGKKDTPVLAPAPRATGQNAIETQRDVISAEASAPTVIARSSPTGREPSPPSPNAVTAQGWAENASAKRRGIAPVIAVGGALLLVAGFVVVRTLSVSPASPDTPPRSAAEASTTSPPAVMPSVGVAPSTAASDLAPPPSAPVTSSAPPATASFPRGGQPRPPAKPRDPALRSIVPDSRD